MKSLFFVTGIPATDPGGTGRFVQELTNVSKQSNLTPAVFHTPDLSNPPRPSYFHSLLVKLRLLKRRYPPGISRTLIKEKNLILLHPQTLTYKWTQDLLMARSHSWLFVLDASFFCVKSYNHLYGEFQPCLRCLGGDYRHIEYHRCEPFPIKQDGWKDFLLTMEQLVNQRRLSFLVQCESHKKLIIRHFGSNALAVNVGLCADFSLSPLEKTTTLQEPPLADVVFHANLHDAKGVSWAMALARLIPERQFLFPFKESSFDYAKPLPANVICKNMQWETGLKEAVMEARVTLCPSLWSAPIEGALIKSLIWGRHVAVVENETAFSSEIPPSVVHHLPREPESAVEKLRELMAGDYHALPVQNWLAAFDKRSSKTYARICDAVLPIDNSKATFFQKMLGKS